MKHDMWEKKPAVMETERGGAALAEVGLGGGPVEQQTGRGLHTVGRH